VNSDNIAYMAFEVFTETGMKNREFISVTSNKSFGLPRAFIKRNGITKRHKAVILYDPESNKVALHFNQNDPKFGFAVRMANPSHGAVIAARSFFDSKGLDPTKYAGRYDFEIWPLTKLGFPENGRAYVISLKEKETNPSGEHDATKSADDEPINLDDIDF
jgi:hypothetical protein